MSPKYLFAIVVLSIFLITLLSTEPIRLSLLQYRLSKGSYVAAEEESIKVMRKRHLLGKLDNEFVKRALDLWNISMMGMMDNEIANHKKLWDGSKSFFIFQRGFLGTELAPRFQRIRMLVQPNLIEESTPWKRYQRLASSIKPYSAEVGFAEHDTHPEFQPLSFGQSGGVALDYNLRSIGVNLGMKKPVVAVRLRHWANTTRVRTENLGLWLSDDNKFYRKYNGKIEFSNEAQSITLDRLEVSCQYLKISCNIKDDQYTLAEDFKNILEIHGPPDFS